MSKLILISGKKQSGKDTSAAYLSSLLTFNGFSTEIYSFATPLKEFLINVFGIKKEQCWGSDEEKNTPTTIKWSDLPLPKDIINQLYFKSTKNFTSNLDDYMSGRQLMEVFGTHICRKMSPNCWVDSSKRYCQSINKDFVFITDARFPNEIDSLLELNPFVIRLLRNPFDSKTDIETALDSYDFKKIPNFYMLDNSELSLEEKQDCLKTFVLPRLQRGFIEVL